MSVTKGSRQRNAHATYGLTIGYIWFYSWRMPVTDNPIQRVVDQLGGYEAAGRACGVSGKAVMKWTRAARLPRTEWTGETGYAAALLAGVAGHGQTPQVSRDELLASGRPPGVPTPAQPSANVHRTKT